VTGRARPAGRAHHGGREERAGRADLGFHLFLPLSPFLFLAGRPRVSRAHDEQALAGLAEKGVVRRVLSSSFPPFLPPGQDRAGHRPGSSGDRHACADRAWWPFPFSSSSFLFLSRRPPPGRSRRKKSGGGGGLAPGGGGTAWFGGAGVPPPRGRGGGGVFFPPPLLVIDLVRIRLEDGRHNIGGETSAARRRSRGMLSLPLFVSLVRAARRANQAKRKGED